MSDAILFDIDGTLVDSTYHHAVAWHRAFHRRELEVPLWRIHRTVGMGGDKLVAAVAGDEVEEEHGDALRDAWREEYTELRREVEELPGAGELVRALVGQGYAVALASSGDPEFSREAADLLGVTDQLSALTTSEDAEDSKPEPDLIGTTLDRLRADGGSVDRAVMVGDTPYDVESAARAGLRCVCVRSGGYGEAELTEAGAALVVDGPADLHDLDWTQYLTDPEDS